MKKIIILFIFIVFSFIPFFISAQTENFSITITPPLIKINMKIELQINTLTIRPEDMQENLVITNGLKSYLINYKLPKRRTYRNKKRVENVIDEIMEGVK